MPASPWAAIDPQGRASPFEPRPIGLPRARTETPSASDVGPTTPDAAGGGASGLQCLCSSTRKTVNSSVKTRVRGGKAPSPRNAARSDQVRPFKSP